MRSNTALTISLRSLVFFFNSNVLADAVSLGAEDDMDAVLSAHKGQRVTLILESGKELSGKVASVNEDAVHLMELSGMEFYDAVIELDAIEAVIVRVRNQ